MTRTRDTEDAMARNNTNNDRLLIHRRADGDRDVVGAVVQGADQGTHRQLPIALHLLNS